MLLTQAKYHFWLIFFQEREGEREKIMFELILFSWCGQAKQIEWNFPEVNEGNDKVRFLKWWRETWSIFCRFEHEYYVEVDGKKQVQIQIFFFRCISSVQSNLMELPWAKYVNFNICFEKCSSFIY